MDKQQELSRECCPEFDPHHWDGKIFEWDDKRFLKDKVSTMFHKPVNFGVVMKKLSDKVEEAGAEIQDALCLADHTSKKSMDVYLAVDKDVLGVENVFFSGKYLFKVYEGDYKNTGFWCKDFDRYVEGKELEIKKMYMWYPYCPKCAKKYGKNYVAIVAKI